MWPEGEVKYVEMEPPLNPVYPPPPPQQQHTTTQHTRTTIILGQVRLCVEGTAPQWTGEGHLGDCGDPKWNTTVRLGFGGG